MRELHGILEREIDARSSKWRHQVRRISKKRHARSIVLPESGR